MPDTATATRPETRDKPRIDPPRHWHVVLLDDDDHSYEYVIRMMIELFRHPPERAFQIAEMVDRSGRAICITTHKEHAELKREQIHGYGSDPLMCRCKGAMSAHIEPACGGDDDGETGDSNRGGNRG